MQRRKMLALALAAVLGRGAPGQEGAVLPVKGDVLNGLPALSGPWSVPAATCSKDGDRRIMAAPFRCSACEAEGRYAPDAGVPPLPDQLLGLRRSDVLGWIADRRKAAGILITTRWTRIVAALPGESAATLSRDEAAWLAELGDKPRGRLTSHARAHAYARRVLEIEGRWMSLLGIDASKRDEAIWPLPPGEVYLFADGDSYREFARHFFRAFGEDASWWLHDASRTIVSALAVEKGGDRVLAARLEHMMAHHLLFQYRSHAVHLPAWVSEGLGHVFERRHPVFEDTYCYRGIVPHNDKAEWSWRKPDWKSEVKEMVTRGDDLPLSRLALADTSTQELPPRQHAQGWSLVCFLLGAGTDRFRAFLDALKRRTADESLPEAQDRAFREAFGAGTAAVQERWRAWAQR